jgi:hypothetical protein
MKVGIYLLVTAIIVWAAGIGLGDSDQTATADELEHNHSNRTSFHLFSLVKPLGISALSSLAITFLIGLFRRKLGQRFLKLHITFASLTVTIALLHGILVLVLF